MDDLNIILRSKSLDAIVIPKVHSTKEIDFVCKMIEFVNPGRRLSLIWECNHFFNNLGISLSF